MDRREFIKTTLSAGVLLGMPTLSTDSWASSRAAKLLRDSVILDMTGANSPIHPVTRMPVAYDTWIQKYKDAGVTWLSMTADSDFSKSSGEMIHMLAANRRYLLQRPDEYIFVESIDDIYRAKREGKLGVNFNFQGSNTLEGDINLVEPLRRLGVGHMLLAYNDSNLAAGGSHTPRDPGLSYFGRQLVKEMNRVGMVVDCTHTGIRSTLEICELSEAPVMFSHSSARALRDHERNITDEQIKACAATGGVIGVNGVALFLSLDPYDTSAAAMFPHIDHMVELVGYEHVGLGLDYVPGNDKPLPVENVVPQYTEKYGEGQYPPINRLAIAGPDVIAPLTEEMIKHGYSNQQIKAILGENFMRLFRQVWSG